MMVARERISRLLISMWRCTCTHTTRTPTGVRKNRELRPGELHLGSLGAMNTRGGPRFANQVLEFEEY
jgi:hypothetical protein